MYIRKLQYIKGTYYMAIPMDVVELLNLKKGDELVLELKNDSMVVKKKEIAFKRADELIDKGELRKIYTIGYEGRTLDEFIDELHEYGIQRLVDIRELPLSRKNGFSKKSLMKELELSGIDYISMPVLGAPRELRHELRSKLMTIYEFLEAYKEYLQRNLNALRELEKYASTTTTAIMCFEADWRECHRSVVAEFLEKDGFEVVHL